MAKLFEIANYRALQQQGSQLGLSLGEYLDEIAASNVSTQEAIERIHKGLFALDFRSQRKWKVGLTNNSFVKGTIFVTNLALGSTGLSYMPTSSSNFSPRQYMPSITFVSEGIETTLRQRRNKSYYNIIKPSS